MQRLLTGLTLCGMSDELLRYDRMVETALRGVVRASLETVISHGLPGEHHFYITFRTTHPGVQIPSTLREQYPEEMTIVLQYQYYDLIVTETDFSVTLSFNNRKEPLKIPYVAISTFVDPSVNFALQFQGNELVEGDEADLDVEPELQATPQQETEAAPTAEASDGNNVVTLDAFRKKT